MSSRQLVATAVRADTGDTVPILLASGPMVGQMRHPLPPDVLARFRQVWVEQDGRIVRVLKDNLGTLKAVA